jgi:hypothetical protein
MHPNGAWWIVKRASSDSSLLPSAMAWVRRGGKKTAKVWESARAIGVFPETALGRRAPPRPSSVVSREKKKKRFRRAARLAILAIPTLDFYG